MTAIWCNPCGAERRNTPAVVKIDGDPMCRPCANYIQKGLEKSGCARLEEEEIAKPADLLSPGLCARGCGKPTHRGSCAGERLGLEQAYRPGQRQATAEIPQPLHGADALRAKGQLAQPAPPVIATVCGVENMPTETREALGQLARSASAACNAFRVVKRADLPAVRRRESVNLNQRVFAAMLAARPEAIEVPVDGWKAGVNLRRRLQLMARPKGLEIDWSRSADFKTFYFWLVDGIACSGGKSA